MQKRAIWYSRNPENWNAADPLADGEFAEGSIASFSLPEIQAFSETTTGWLLLLPVSASEVAGEFPSREFPLGFAHQATGKRRCPQAPHDNFSAACELSRATGT